MRTLEQTSVISAVDRELLAEVKGVVQRFVPTAELLLYGSAARGTQGPESDYDLLVLTERPLSTQQEEAVWDALFDLEMKRGAVLSAQFCARSEWERHRSMPFYVEVDRDGIAL